MPPWHWLLNYRHSNLVVTEQAQSAWQGMQSLSGEERTNYPLTLNVDALNVDDLGEDLLLTAQTAPVIAAKRICVYMQQALLSLVEALEQGSATPLQTLPVLPDEERQLLLEGFKFGCRRRRAGQPEL